MSNKVDAGSLNKLTPPASSASENSEVKRKRGRACIRCHKRRVKCDASIHGTPCSACKGAHVSGCTLLDSRRRRGPAGTFITSDEGAEDLGITKAPTSKQKDASPGVEPRAKGRLSMASQEPDISMDLAKLCGVDSDDVGPNILSSKRSSDSGPIARTRQQGKASFLGESWYASYLLSNTFAGHVDLHQPVGRYQNKASMRSQPEPKEISPKVLPSDMPSTAILERLLDAYASRFHAFCPILDISAFRSSMRDGTASHTLLRCVLFVSLIHCDPEVYHLMGYSNRLDAGDEYFEKARAAFDTDTESDRITMLLSSYLLHYYFGQSTTYRDCLWWLSSAIRSAQCMGMHRNTSNSRMPEAVRRRWRRIWWCLYIRDRQVAISVGAPMIINDLDCDVEPLTSEDLTDVSPETCAYIIAQVDLNRAACSLYYAHCCPSRLRLSPDINTRNYAKQNIQSALRTWYDSLPTIMVYDHGNKNHLSLTLHMIYHFYSMNLHQRLQRKCHDRQIESEGSDMILYSAGEVTKLVEDMMMNWSPEFFPMICVSAIFASMTIQLVESHSSDAMKSQLLSQQLRINLLGLKQFEQCYILARWIRKLFLDILEKSATTRNIRTDSRSMSHRQGANILSPHSSNPEISFPSNLSSSLSLNHGADSSMNSFSPSALSNGSASNLSPWTSSQDPIFFMPNELHPHLDYPSPSSFEYQGLQFMADLGFAGFNGDLNNL